MAPASSALNILVTGGARGIGRGLARLLLEAGHRVFILDNNEAEILHIRETFAPYILSSKLTVHRCDLRDIDAIGATVDYMATVFDKHLDVLINNAAKTDTVGDQRPAMLDMEEWKASLEVNLTAPMHLLQACWEQLIAAGPKRPRGGSIINISSTRALQSEAFSEPYATTKAGLLGLTHSLAVSLAGDGIRVNAILPGWIHVLNECRDADVTGAKWEDGLTEQDLRWHLTGRVGRVEDVYKAVEYLISAEFVTGTEMVVDGGVTKKMVYPS